MSKTLYEEALADARQLKDVAEKNAQRAVIDSVTPKIKEMIERQLLGESLDEELDESLDEIGGLGGSLGVTHPSLDGGASGSTPSGDDSGDEAAPVEESDDVYEITSEAASKLGSLSDSSSSSVNDRFEVGVYRVVETTNGLVSAGSKVKLSDEYSRKIVETIQKIEDMYSYLQESGDSTRKIELEKKLESCFEVLNAVKESTMRMKDLLSKENLTEDLDMDPTAAAPAAPAGAEAPAAGGKELTMKITGLPDDVELDKLNIDLISDDDADAGEPPMDGAPELDADPAAAGGAPMEMNVFEDDAVEETDDLSELDEDDVVEISETMLKKELARLLGKNLNEMDADVLDDFGGGSDEGDAWLDGEVSTADKDNMIKQGDNGMGAKTGGKKALAAAKAAIAERKARDSKKVTETAKSAVSQQLAESRAANESLRTQLTELNLFSAKLLHANKLLQLEGLSAHAKSVIIDKLDDAENLREVKLVYEGLVKLLTGDKKKAVTESTQQRAVLAGSSSRTTRSATSKVDEGYETARWATLAGLKK